MKFNEKLLSLRKEKGYSQEILADKLNVSRQTISKWESGITTPELEKIILLSEIFNISIDELIGKEKPDKPEKNEEDNKLNFKKFKNKIIKNIIITLFIILIVSLFSFILYRYLIVDTIYKRILYCEPKKNEFCYTKQIMKYEKCGDHAAYFRRFPSSGHFIPDCRYCRWQSEALLCWRAADERGGEPGLCGGVRAGSGPGPERTDLLRGHRGLHAVRPVLHPAPVPNRPGHPVVAIRRCRRRAGV